MVTYKWAIKLPLQGSNEWFTLCTIISPEAVAEIVRILVRTAPNGPLRIELELIREETTP